MPEAVKLLRSRYMGESMENLRKTAGEFRENMGESGETCKKNKIQEKPVNILEKSKGDPRESKKPI